MLESQMQAGVARRMRMVVYWPPEEYVDAPVMAEVVIHVTESDRL